LLQAFEDMAIEQGCLPKDKASVAAPAPPTANGTHSADGN
jgi:hypothetical protein